jgi:hypothetical protein
MLLPPIPLTSRRRLILETSAFPLRPTEAGMSAIGTKQTSVCVA